MQYRGSLGESLLHVLIICDSKLHTRLARTLLKCFPKQSLDVVEGEDYLGASALHLAIAYANNELVQDLIEAGANVSQRAIGSFFLPRDQQLPRPTKQTDYEGLAYLGEFPLAWAACCANESVYNLLLDNAADPDFQDSFGNMILHMVVVCDKLDMFGYALRHPKLPAKNGMANAAGLTPLTLACKLGRATVFQEMLELSAREYWRYSNITCSAYPLNALDTLLPDGRTNWNSALFIILNGTKEEHLDMLDGGIIQRLLEEKWKTFARNQFLKRLLILALHLATLTMAVYLRPKDVNTPLIGNYEWTNIGRYGFEIGTIASVVSYVVFQQGEEIKNQGLCSFIKQLPHAPAKAIFLVSNLLLLACIPFRLMEDKRTEEAILLIAVPGSWFLLMFFAGGTSCWDSEAARVTGKVPREGNALKARRRLSERRPPSDHAQSVRRRRREASHVQVDAKAILRRRSDVPVVLRGTVAREERSDPVDPNGKLPGIREPSAVGRVVPALERSRVRRRDEPDVGGRRRRERVLAVQQPGLGRSDLVRHPIGRGNGIAVSVVRARAVSAGTSSRAAETAARGSRAGRWDVNAWAVCRVDVRRAS